MSHVRPEVHVDLGERAGERDDVDVVVEASHRRAGGAPVGLVERLVRQPVLVGQRFELLDRRVDDVDPRDGRFSNTCDVCIEVSVAAVRATRVGTMGQQVSVVEKPSPRPGVMRFETNRTLTGMGHERFTSMADAVGPRPAAALARQLLATGKVDSVYMYGNIISVDITKGFNADGLGDVVRNMYQYWKPGMEMPTFDAPAEEAATKQRRSGRPAAADSGESGGAVDSAYTRLVPQSLRERSAAALAKALGKQLS